jgi:acetyltransferase
LGDASPERYAKALEIAANDPHSDGMLVILTPQAMTDPTATAEMLKPYAQSLGKPVLASWMGGSDVETGESILNFANIPTFPYPDTAARMFDYMAQYSSILDRLYETPTLPPHGGNVQVERAAEIIQRARQSGRTILTEYESKQLLAAYDIPTVETRIAESVDQAVSIANEIGYPVVLKLHSEVITHKTDVGGVQLNLADEQAVRRAYLSIQESVREKAGEFGPDGRPNFLGVTVQPMSKLDGYELILGSSIDAQFGPVLLFGMGGQLVEVFKDRSLGLPPLNSTLARRMMERTKIYTALKGVRGRKPVDLDALEQLLVRFSNLISEQRWIKELDINPLLASSERLLALDARVVVYGPEVSEEQLPRLAIRPYPSRYSYQWVSKEGWDVTIRPIRAEDEPALVSFHEGLSDRSVYMRYMQPMLLSDRVAHQRLARIAHSDYDREMTLVAERTGEGCCPILAVGRLSKLHGTSGARFTILVCDECQGQGIGSELLKRLISVARDEKLDQVEAVISPDNEVMKSMVEKIGFQLSPMGDGKMLRAVLDL